MAFVPAPNIVLIEVIALKDGQVIENTIHMDVFHEPTLGDLNGIAAFISGWCSSTYAINLSQDVTITSIKCTSLHAQNAPQVELPVNIPGVVASDSLPNEVSYCVSLRSGWTGRSARGRWYVLAVALNQRLGENRVTSTFRTAITGALQDLIDDTDAAGNALVVVSYTNNGAPRVGGPVYFKYLTATTSDDVLDSQRRRKPGVGT